MQISIKFTLFNPSKTQKMANHSNKFCISQKIKQFALISYVLSKNIDSVFHTIKKKKFCLYMSNNISTLYQEVRNYLIPDKNF